MAYFCKQCAEEFFDSDFSDFVGITSKEDFRQDKAALVLCEGCGPIFVDPDGKCVSSDCDKKHV